MGSSTAGPAAATPDATWQALLPSLSEDEDK
jgi:hypothetical protein